MRHFVITIMLVLGFSVTLKAEFTPLPLVREGVEWGYATGYGGGDYKWADLKYYRLQFYGDTVINSRTYKKLYKYNTEKLDTNNAILDIVMRQEGGNIYGILTKESVDWQEDWDMHGLFTPEEFSYSNEEELWIYGITEDLVGITGYGFHYDKNDPVMINGEEHRHYKVKGHLNCIGSYIDGIGIAAHYERVQDLGNIPFPSGTMVDMSFFFVVMFYVRDLEGNYIYKSPVWFDWYAEKDPTVELNELKIIPKDDEDEASAPLGYYDLTGRRVERPSKGIYILRQGSLTRKVVF